MAELCELRYNRNDINFIDSDDMLLIFNGYVFVLHEDEDANRDGLMNVLNVLCNAFPKTKNIFFGEDGNLKSKYKENDILINDIYEVYHNFAKVVIGIVFVDENNKVGLDLAINDSYDVANSQELNQLMKSEIGRKISKITMGDKIIRMEDTNNKPNSIQLANPLYHGTTESSLYGIFTKGLRKLQELSKFHVNNEGFVFLTSVFQIAKEYAEDYATIRNSNMAVLKVNSNLIDKDKIVLDYDFVKQFTQLDDNNPYKGIPKDHGMFTGKMADNSRRYGSKFAKLGYKGIIMPNAIEGVYLFSNNRMEQTYYTREEYLNIYKQKSVSNESKNHINEWKPNNFAELPQKIRLYHGTDIFALEDILLDGEINARYGKRTGETYGVNWFFTSFKDNFSRGVVFSIEVDKSEFENHTFEFMNWSEVTSRDNSVSIQGRNFRIEELDWYNQETFSNILKKCNGDIYDFANYIGEHNKLLNQIGEYRVDDVVILQILRQTVGEDFLRKEGVLESVSRINEVDSSDISLKSFKVKNELNPKIWVNNKINSRVRLRLLDIADDFIDNLAVRWVKPKDIVITGSIANYNWSSYSDIDVHIIMDYSQVYKKKEFVEDYFNSKKEIWKRDHDDLKIYGFPVEIYVEDSAAKSNSSGIYSLNKNEWIKEPTDLDNASLNEKYIKNEAAKYMTLIDDYKKDLNKEKDSYKIERIGNKVKKLFDKLKGIRKESLKRSGEMGSGNIIYKILRRAGYLDIIWNIINDTYNKSKTLK